MQEFTGCGAGLPSRGGLLTALVLERELKLGAERDRPALVQVDVLRDDLGDSKIAERLARGPDRLGGGVLPRRAAGADDVDHPVHAHASLPSRPTEPWPLMRPQSQTGSPPGR